MTKDFSDDAVNKADDSLPDTKLATSREAPPFKEININSRQWAHLRCDPNRNSVGLRSKVK